MCIYFDVKLSVVCKSRRGYNIIYIFIHIIAELLIVLVSWSPPSSYLCVKMNSTHFNFNPTKFNFSFTYCQLTWLHSNLYTYNKPARNRQQLKCRFETMLSLIELDISRIKSTFFVPKDIKMWFHLFVGYSNIVNSFSYW